MHARAVGSVMPRSPRRSERLFATTSSEASSIPSARCAHRDAGGGARRESGAEQASPRDFVAAAAQLARHVGRHLLAVRVARHDSRPAFPAGRGRRFRVHAGPSGRRCRAPSTRRIAAAILLRCHEHSLQAFDAADCALSPSPAKCSPQIGAGGTGRTDSNPGRAGNRGTPSASKRGRSGNGERLADRDGAQAVAAKCGRRRLQSFQRATRPSMRGGAKEDAQRYRRHHG
jgi:hypothetical protein